MTSNLGSDLIAQHAGNKQKQEEAINQEIKTHFKPEFINRVDDIIIFQPLTQEQIKEIVKLQVAEINQQLQLEDLSIELTNKAIDHFAEVGFDQVYGARPLKRLMQKEILDVLAIMLIKQEIKPGSKLEVDWDGRKVIIGGTK